jgi:16S rRNA (cytosine967-C5)-methyltransferase
MGSRAAPRRGPKPRTGRAPAAPRAAGGSLVGAAVRALTQLLKFEHPADQVLSRYFRGHPALGQSDRAFVAETVFGVLRRKRILAHLAKEATPHALVLAWLARYSDMSLRELTPRLTREEVERVAHVKAATLEGASPAVLADLPDWAYALLSRELPDSEVLALGRALQEPAPLDLRVNTTRADRLSVQRALVESGIGCALTPYSPLGLRVAGKPALNRHPLFLNGTFEVQDEGSQLVGLLVAPRRHDLVVDFCAGAGGKTLMLAAMMHSHGRVYAFDVSPARLARLKPRLRRSGLSNVHPHLLAHERDVKVKRLAGKIDRVLVDAPCSGLGTLRRNPDLKWRQSPAALAEMCTKQSAILESAARLVKPGGRLIYATCSLLRAENEDIVEAFVAGHPRYALLDCAEILQQHGVALDTGRCLRLWPHVHGTDGFFAAAFERARESRE